MKWLWENINIFFGSELWNNAVLPLGIVVLTSGVIGLFVSRTIEKQRHNQALNLEKETFIREITSKEKEELLKGWAELVLDKDQILNPKHKELVRKFNNLFLKTAMYGGEKLVSLVTLFQKNNVKNSVLSQSVISEKQQYKVLVYLAVIVSEIKYEFTDVKVNPLTLIELKFNDYDSKSEIIFKAYEEIEAEIEDYMKKDQLTE